MNPLERNGGTAGIVAAALLALGIILGFYMPGIGATFGSPLDVLSFVTANRWVWRISSILGILTAAFAVPFSIGIWRRLREPAPTRAAVALAFALVGLAGYALSSLLIWKGGIALASYAAKDTTAAATAWLALRYVARGATDLGNAFVGTALMVAGWAIVATGALRQTVGWLGALSGVLTLLTIFPLSGVLDLAGGILTVVWLGWVGNELRRSR